MDFDALLTPGKRSLGFRHVSSRLQKVGEIPDRGREIADLGTLGAYSSNDIVGAIGQMS